MALAGRKGFSLASLYEKEITLEEVISHLGFKRMSSDEKAAIRGKLAEVIGAGLQRIELSKKLNPGSRLQSKGLAASLKAVARNLQEAETTLRGLQTGLRQGYQIAAAIRIKQSLSENPELKNSPAEFLSDFCTRMNAVTQACLVAASDLKSMKAKAGRKSIDWYDDFTRILIFIAEQNNISTTIVTDRVTGKPKGRFLELGAAFERLLYPPMRSPSRGALAKRLSRSLRRVK